MLSAQCEPGMWKRLFRQPLPHLSLPLPPCCSPLLKKTTTHLGQLRESTGEFGRSAQGTPKLTITKLSSARFRSTSRSVLLSDESVFTHSFINTTLSTATFIF